MLVFYSDLYVVDVVEMGVVGEIDDVVIYCILIVSGFEIDVGVFGND